MPDNTQKTGGQDRKRINVNQDYELQDWSEKLGASDSSFVNAATFSLLLTGKVLEGAQDRSDNWKAALGRAVGRTRMQDRERRLLVLATIGGDERPFGCAQGRLRTKDEGGAVPAKGRRGRGRMVSNPESGGPP